MCPTIIALPHRSGSLLLAATLLLGIARPAQSVSTLFVDGDLGFSTATAQMQIDGVLTAAAGLVPTPVLAGSQFLLAASFLGVSSHGGITTATFGTAPAVPDVMLIGGDNTLLLAGELQSLSAMGVNGIDSAVLTGELAPTGGSLMQTFANPTGLMELQLDLSAPFRSGIFNQDFSGHINGRLESLESFTEPVPLVATSIPEPATWGLMTVGLLGLWALPLRRGYRTGSMVRATPC